MIYRNEIKHVITPGDKAAICAGMRAIAQLDPHAREKGHYRIRSLYFDNLYDKALMEKIDGVSEREKFRIRYYDGDLSLIHLEKKVKRGGLGYKISETISREEAQKIISGDTDWMAVSGRGLLIELYSKMKSQCLRPQTIVDYDRIPFVYGPGNVRVTIDWNIRTGSPQDFLNPNGLTLPLPDSTTLLEVKWDEYLPNIIRQATALRSRQPSAFSKYAACRVYG